MRVQPWLLVFLFSLNSYATSPVYTELGRKRIQENISMLQTNIGEVEKNLEASKKNSATLEAELKDLNSLITQHAELKKKYEDYLSQSATETEKNDVKLNKLERYLKNISPEVQSSQTGKIQAEVAKKEIAERNRWKKDASAKIKRVRDLLSVLEENTQSLKARVAPLKLQQQEWKARETEFQKTLVELKGKKSQFEKLAQKQ